MTELVLAEARMLRSNAYGGVGVLISLVLLFYRILPSYINRFKCFRVKRGLGRLVFRSCNGCFSVEPSSDLRRILPNFANVFTLTYAEGALSIAWFTELFESLNAKSSLSFGPAYQLLYRVLLLIFCYFSL